MTFETKDSGKRQDYASGMRRDTQEGKARFDLIRPLGVPYKDQMFTRLAELMARGAEKYGERNWEKASSAEELARFKGSAERHLQQYLNGDTEEDHAAAVMFNLIAAEYVNGKLTRTGRPKINFVSNEDWEKTRQYLEDALRTALRHPALMSTGPARPFKSFDGYMQGVTADKIIVDEAPDFFTVGGMKMVTVEKDHPILRGQGWAIVSNDDIVPGHSRWKTSAHLEEERKAALPDKIHYNKAAKYGAAHENAAKMGAYVRFR